MLHRAGEGACASDIRNLQSVRAFLFFSVLKYPVRSDLEEKGAYSNSQLQVKFTIIREFKAGISSGYHTISTAKSRQNVCRPSFLLASTQVSFSTLTVHDPMPKDWCCPSGLGLPMSINLRQFSSDMSSRPP